MSFALVLFMLGRFIGTALMSKIEARKVVAWYSIAAVILIGAAFALGGFTAIICIMLAFFCQSIMFPTIFALATKGMDAAESKQASSLVIMSIVGGAIMPPLAGKLAGSGDMLMALIIPFLCFAYIVWYLLRYPKLSAGKVG
jgi:FHS family L-fucose permease-like MFS transporter